MVRKEKKPREKSRPFYLLKKKVERKKK